MRRIQRVELYYNGVPQLVKEHAAKGWEGYDDDDWISRASTFNWLMGEVSGRLFESGSIHELLNNTPVDPSKFEIKLMYVDTEFQDYSLCARCGFKLQDHSDESGEKLKGLSAHVDFAGICWTCIVNQINLRDAARAAARKA